MQLKNYKLHLVLITCRDRALSYILETLPIDDSVDAIGIGYAGLCGLRNNIN